MRDIVHNIGVLPSIVPADLSVSTTGATIDLLGFDSVAFIVNTGTITGAGAFTLGLQESSDGTLFTVVPTDLLQAPVSGNLAAGSTAKVGYRGFKRYVRPVLTKVSGTSIVAGVVAVKGRAAERPVA